MNDPLKKSSSQALNEDAYDLRLLSGDDAQGWMPPLVSAATADQGPSSEEQIHALLDEARREGLALGREEGRREYDARIAQLNQLIAALSGPLAEIDERVETQLAELALVIGKQLALFNLVQKPEQICALVRESLGEMPVASDTVRIKLNPADAQLIRADAALDGRLDIVEDPGLRAGGCMLMAGSSCIDNRFETRLAALIEEMFDGGIPTGSNDEQEQGA